MVLKKLKAKESCNGHNIYILESSPELQSKLIPYMPIRRWPNLDDYYGYLQFINYKINDSLY